MKLSRYRSFRPLDESTRKMDEFYGKKGITESFLKDIQFSGPHEIAWILSTRSIVGKMFAKRLKSALRTDNHGIEIEERSKSLSRVAEKLRRKNRMPGGMEGPDYMRKLLHLAGFEGELHSLGSVRDWYGIRLIIPSGPSSRESCYALLESVFDIAEIADITEVSALVDYISYREARFSENGKYLGRYESIHLSFIHLGIPIEVQIRDSEMDWYAKNRVKRTGLD